MQRAALDRAQGALSVLAASGATDPGGEPTPRQQAAARARAEARALADRIAEMVNAGADLVAVSRPLAELEVWTDIAWALSVSTVEKSL